MSAISERLLWGRPERRTRHWSVFVGGFAGVVLVLLLVVTFGGGRGSGLVYDHLLPAALFYAPPVVAALSAVRGGGLLVSVAVGLVPALSFGVVALLRRVVTGAATGESPLWTLVVAFGIVGLVGASVGFALGRGAVRLRER
ncbi:hypothetical protein [Haladaptatus salinisoli]|uniref:hypothetical protein n=1 Tax=Haladaptatus salinisoli TaxID=2884876 RepID=UPI001D0B266F|nr:hypothetical protein [Haladaptatus salinisoli]